MFVRICEISNNFAHSHTCRCEIICEMCLIFFRTGQFIEDTVSILEAKKKKIQKVCVWSVGLELLYARMQRKFDFGVVHLLYKRSAGLCGLHGLNANNLDGVDTSAVTVISRFFPFPVPLSFTFKICQIVAGTSMIRRFHEFFEYVMGLLHTTLHSQQT